MNIRMGWLCAGLVGAVFTGFAGAGEIYVRAAGGNDANDGSTWELAKQTIQGGVDAARPGDVVWVTNGVYETGSRVTPGYQLRNRVVITNDIVVRSVNGPAETIIRGQGPRGTNAIRCVYMAAGKLIGFTVTNSYTRLDGDGTYDQNGGGINMYPATSAVVSNCVITGCHAHDSAGSTWGVLYNCTFIGNSAERASGGASCATLYNCVITGNSGGSYGGGADQSTLNNCTVTGNTAANGGGVYHCTLNNCIVYSNSPANMSWVTCRYTCTTPLQSGEGNIADDPKLVSASHIAADSPCIGRGSAAYAFGTDIDGEAWLNPPSMGCDEPVSGPVTGELAVAIITEASTVVEGVELSLTADIQGQWTSNRWDFGDGTASPSALGVSHAWAETGDYAVVLTAYNETHPEGVSATAAVSVVELAPPCTRHVWQDSLDPAYPYDSWDHAAHTIQEAVDAALPGDEVWVTNGVYETGSRVPPGLVLRNRVVITNDIVVRSVNGPAETIIRGQGPRGTNAIRCVYMTAGKLIGFTVTNGHTRTDGDGNGDQNGGGLSIPSSLPVLVSNCVFEGNCAYNGGGSIYGTYYNCVFRGNHADRAAGATTQGARYNCEMSGNTAAQYGGATDQCTLYNCTVTGNTAANGGGVYNCTLYNCIAYSNSPANMAASTCSYTCASPLPSGTGNIADDPKFVSTSHIAADSPCIGRGSAAYAFGTDIDGEAWLNPPSMGCDEPAVGPVTGELAVAISPSASTVVQGVALSLSADIQGRTTSNRWDFGDGASSPSALGVSHAWAETGDYAVVLTAYNETHPEGVSATAAVSVVELAPPCTRYVWQDSPAPAYPFAAWSNAAHTIQEAVDAALPGDVVWVTNGVYETGSRVTPGYQLRNRVVITNDIVVRSVNGPAETIIRGQGPRGTNAIRCVYMAAGKLIGFTVTNSYTRLDGDGTYDQNGGGINMFPSTSAVVSNCVITACYAHDSAGSTWGVLYNCTFIGNSAERASGGASCATLYNCVITGNSGGSYGGGADQSTLNNCTVTGNTATYGGGVYHCTLNNCIVYSNSPANVSWVTCRYTCTTPLQGGEGNIADDPKLGSASHIAADSPCIGRGSAAYAFGTDIDGEAWGNPPSMGCDEPAVGPVTGELAVAISPSSSTVVQGVALSLSADIQGRTTSNRWDFGDGTASPSALGVSHAWAETGEYAVVLTAYNETYPEGVSATAAVSVVELAPPCTRYVWQDSPAPAYPFAAWSNAAHTIQEAVDAALPGDEVWVTNGVYETGSRATPGHQLLNRVVITNDIVVRSVNGPAETIIRGQGPRGTNAIRCVYMAAGRLIGFTVADGHTRLDGDGNYNQNGGGINMFPSTSAVVSNCVITGCRAHDSAGATWGVLYNCTFSGNSAERAAGGASCATLYNCAISGNSGGSYGGGADQSTLYNCTVTGNSAANGGGVFHCTLNNCIVYSNSPANMSWVTCRYTCTTPLQDGEGNIADDPKLAPAAHIAADSPCVGRGSAAYAFGTDIDGEAWGNPPSMGCDEPAVGPVTGELAVAISPAASTVVPGVALSLSADIQGRTTSNRWDFGDGALEANASSISHAWAETGEYAVVLTAYNETYPEGVSATAAVSVVVLAPPCTRYVWQDSLDPAYPYDSWDHAAHTIQEAVDAALPGDEVWVTNGVYETGSRVTPGYQLRNRVVITNDIVVRSVNGPDVTIIRGQGPRGPEAIRCVYMAAGKLIGFTVTNSYTRLDGDGNYDQNGGGINMFPATSAVVSNCVITGCHAHDSAGATWGVLYNCTFIGNSAERAAGGASCATLYNCAISGNNATYYGGGADQCELYNCTLVGNSAQYGGGAFNCRLYNSIAYSNSASSGMNVNWATCRHSCVAPLQAGEGNIADDPKLAPAAHIAADSPCVGRGSAAYAFGTDIDGEAWGNPPSMGCDEPAVGPVTGELAVAISPSASTVVQGVALSLSADIQGPWTSNRWDFGDGASAPSALDVSHAWTEAGDYAVVLTAYNETYPEGVSATASVSVVQILDRHAVTATSGPGGVIEPSGTIWVSHGSDAGFQIQSSNGFHIARVLVDGQDAAEFDVQSTNYSCTLSAVTADHDVEARFNSAPVMGVSVAPTQGVAPLRVKFDFGTSVDAESNIVRSEVDWSDDATADWSADGPAVIVGEYAAPGVYTNLLRVTDGFGLSDSTIVVVTVLGQAPTAVLTASTNSVPAPMAVTLSAAGSEAAMNHALVAYEWDFDGDGVYDEFTAQALVEHAYGEAGIYPASVRVTDDQGLQDMASLVLTVLAPPNHPPVVSLTNQPASGTIPLEVVSIAIASDADGVIESYAWDFDGDGTTDLIGANPVVTQRYGSVGTFEVSVRVTDDDGLVADASAWVTAHEASKLKTWISSPRDGGRVWGSDVTVQAQTAPGHLTASVQIQYKPAASTEWIDIGPRLLPPASSFQASWNVSDLIDGQAYDLRSVALDTESNAVVSETVTVFADDSADETPGQTLEMAVGGKLVKRQTFGREERAACILADGTAVYMPAGSVASDPTFTIEVVGVNTNPVNGAAHGLESAGANRKVSLAGGLPFQQPVIIEIPYADANRDGLVDGTGIPAETLGAYWFDPDAQEWKRVLEAVVDQTACRVRLKASHLTEFGLFGEVSLLSPAKGGMLLSGVAGSTNYAGPENLTDGNRASYWRSGSNPTGNARFTYGFTQFSGAILDEAIIYNTGCGETNAYSKDFEILTSMDGSNFTVAVAGTLAAVESPETFGLGGTTCRFVQIVVKSGYSTEAWALAEVSLKGTLTADPDADGLDDAWEMQYFSTFDWGGADDFETDGLDNLGEFELGGDPTVRDTDGDGMPDEWEARHGFLLAVPDAGADDDGDRMPNLHEYIAGTDPTNSASLLEMAEPIYDGTWRTNVTPEGETQAWLQIERSILGWQTVTGRTYRLYSKTNLLSESWQEDLGPVSGTGARVAFTNDTGSREFFGVGVTLSP